MISKDVVKLIGKWVVSPFFAVGSSLMTTVALSSLPYVVGLTLPWLVVVLTSVFIAEAVISLYLFKKSVPDTLVSLFFGNIFEGFNLPKKILLGLGMFSALGGGLALAAMTYTSGTTAIATVLSLFSFSSPLLGAAIAGVLAVAGFVAVSSLLIKWISVVIKQDAHKQAINYFKNIFIRDINKPLLQQILETGFKLFFISSIVVLTVIGTIATLGTMQKGLAKFLLLIPKANVLAVNIASRVIVFGLMGPARLPLILQSVSRFFSKAGEVVGREIFQIGIVIAAALGLYKPIVTPKKVATEKSSYKTIATSFVKASAMVIHGISSGALAASGGGQVLAGMMSGLQLPLSLSAMEQAGQIAAMASAGTMSAGVGGFTLFADKIIDPPANLTTKRVKHRY